MITPLVINRNCYFDESPGGECLRAFLGAMQTFEWSPVVYASDRRPRINPVPSYAHLTCERVYIRYLAAAIRRVLVPDLTYLPDYVWYSWGKGVVKQIDKDIKSGMICPDYIHSVAYPIGSHWAALQVKRATGLPWVMQFYDPWADNPFRTFKTEWLKRKDWKMERAAVEAADLIIHDNDIIANIWRERYGATIAKKIKVLPLTVPLPKSEVLTARSSDADKLVVAHIGNFSDVRRAEPFVMAVIHLFKFYPELRGRLLVHFIGEVFEKDKELIYNNALEDVFVLHGTLSATECEPFYNSTDVFLSEEGFDASNKIFFPSKILKYFYYQRPILGISPKGTVLETELSKAGHEVYLNTDIEGISGYLYRAITDYRSLLTFNKDYWHTFEPENVICQYKTYIDEIIKNTIK